MDLLNEINYKLKQLDISVKKLRETGTRFAEAERDYKIVLNKETLRLRNEQEMPVTLIPLRVYGIKEVALKRFERDVAEAIYKSNQEAINTVKLQIKILDAQLSREWGVSK